MLKRNLSKGFTLIEVLVAVAIFFIFAMGVYSTINIIFKIVYQSRMKILETALLNEKMEVIRNMKFEDVGTEGGLPSGDWPASTTTIRNGVTFVLTTTIRNVDDAFDGTMGGTPDDASPADYKLVEMTAVCTNCAQQIPVVMSTKVAPKQLEGASENGALFVYVFDAFGLPVSEASVHVTNNQVSPVVDLTDTTGADGMLKILDAPTGTMSYNINVTKSGHSSDYTVSPSVSNPNPVKPPSNVVSQMITDISFSIDDLGGMDISTVDSACNAIGSVPFSIHGNKVIGTDPDIYKYSADYTTSGGGLKSLANMEWDRYSIDITGGTYDLAGASPPVPVNLTPGLAQNVFLTLASHSSDSLLVLVNDAGTGLPLSGASVRLYSGSYDNTLTTGLGYVRQTNWNGGSGQTDYTDQTKYFSDSGSVDNNSPVGDLKLKKSGSRYLGSANLESSTIDLGQSVNFGNIIFTPLSQPAQCGANPITFQIATRDTVPGTWTYLGPDGTDATFYNSASTVIWSGHNGRRYMRYKVFLNTADDRYTPTLSEAAFTYTNSCTPPGQTFFSSLSAGAYILEVSRSGYSTNSGTLDISGTMSTVVNLSVE